MPWSRKKSCERCRASKARCNQATPTCSRCSERQLQCVYDRGDTDFAAHYSYSQVADSDLETSTEASSWARISSELGLGSGATLVASQPFSLEVDGMLPDFDQDLQLDWATTDGLNSDRLAIIKAFRLPGPESRERDGFFNDTTLPTTPAHISLEGATSWNPSLLQNLSGGPITGPTSSRMTVAIEQPKAQRTFMRRGAHKTCPLTSMVLGQIVSYPRMMTVGDQLPPFIQPPCHIDEEFAQDCAESGKHICLPKDLAACSSLVQMVYQRTTANSPFGWKLIYAEVERLRQEVR
jgi:Fungal Zn(2)-Cys(6) binuclear cluster domain